MKADAIATTRGVEVMSDIVEHQRLTSLDDLKPASYNPRRISRHAASGLRASIESFGDISGIVWNARTENLVSGHQRVDQLRKLGGELIHTAAGSTVVRVTAHGRTLDFPVRVVDWSEADEKTANLTANNHAVAGEFTEGLQALLDEVRRDIDVEQFEALRLAAIMDIDGAKPEATITEDEIPEPPRVAVTQPGDVWLLGRHRLLCGDSTSKHGLEVGADCTFTDPPYGVDYVSRVDEARRKNWGGIANDDLRGNALRDFLRSTVRLSAFTYVCCDWHTYSDFEAALGKPKAVCVWDKGHFGLGKGYRRQHEFILFYGTLNCTDLSDVWSFSREVNYQHPTQKPVALVAKALVDCGATSVFDPFLGSGTTLIAAEQTGAKCSGVELEPKYCDVIVERWERLTGGKALRQNHA